MKRSRSMVTQTVQRVSVAFAAAIFLISVFFTVYICSYMKENILEGYERQVETAASSLESRLESMTGPLLSLAEYPSAVRLLKQKYPKFTPEWMDNIRNLDDYLKNINLFNDYIIDVLLITEDSECVYSLSDLMRAEYDYTGADWFREALEQETLIKCAPPHGLDHFYQDFKGTSVSFIYPVYASRRLIGYIIFECDLLRIADFLNQPSKADAGFILLNSDGQRIYHYPGEEEDDETKRILSDHAEEGSLHSARGGSYYVIRHLKESGWSVIWKSEDDIVWNPLLHLIGMIFLILAVSVLILYGINVYNIRCMEKPMNALISRIRSYSGERTPEKSEAAYEQAPAEIVLIHEQFEDMADKITGLIQDVYVAQLKQKEAELEALINQINPHFLYNVLQTIQTKAVLADAFEVEEMIQALSHMMRYAMDRSRDKVRVKEEIAYLRNYLMFYKVRFPQKFEYEMNIEDALEDELMLKFILQPVVENCFKHALRDVKAGGKISVKAVSDDAYICFTIRDNGCGMNEKKLSELREKLDSSLIGNGIGVVNTHTRIRLVYGEDCGLSVESREGVFTEFMIRIRKEG